MLNPTVAAALADNSPLPAATTKSIPTWSKVLLHFFDLLIDQHT